MGYMYSLTEVFWFYVIGVVVSYFLIGVYNYMIVNYRTKTIEDNLYYKTSVALLNHKKNNDSEIQEYRDEYINKASINGWVSFLSWMLPVLVFIVSLIFIFVNFVMMLDKLFNSLNLSPVNVIRFIIKPFKK